MRRLVDQVRTPALYLILLLLAACGGGGSGGGGSNPAGPGPSAPTYTIGGDLSGLGNGKSVVLRNNGVDDLTRGADGAFTFANPSSTYNVTVLTQPAGQTCLVSNGSGTAGANITNVSVVCTDNPAGTFTIGGTVAGLTGTVELLNNNADNLLIAANGAFNFATATAAYDVTVLTQPAGQTCTVSNGQGAANAVVTTVAVNCVTNPPATFSVGGTVTGLAGGERLRLHNNGGDELLVTANGAFVFATPVANAAAYAVTIFQSNLVAGKICSVASGTGVISGANVNNVSITCSTSSFTVGGAVSGLTGTVVLTNQGGDNLSINSDGAFTFATPVVNGGSYFVDVFSQPAGQVCSVGDFSGIVSGANVTSVTVTCSSNTRTVGGTVKGLAGTLVLRNNGGNDLSINANGPYVFSAPVAQGATYEVSVFSQPAGQVCSVANSSGSVGIANIDTVDVACVANTYTVGGTAAGLTAPMVLRNNGGDDLTVDPINGGLFTFATPITQGGNYNVSVFTQPTGQTCSVSNGSGTVQGANITTVSITCSANTYTVGGSVAGLTGSVVLRNNGGDNLTLNANGAFTFNTPIADGGPFQVTVFTQPVGQSCGVSNGTGIVNGSNVNTVAVTCSANSYTVGGTVTGLSGTVILRNNGANNLSLAANGAFAFAGTLANGAAYNVTVFTQPASQTCTVSNGSGTINAANVANVGVNCVANPLPPLPFCKNAGGAIIPCTGNVGGFTSGVQGTIITITNAFNGDTYTTDKNGPFRFGTVVNEANPVTIALSVAVDSALQQCSVTGENTDTNTNGLHAVSKPAGAAPLIPFGVVCGSVRIPIPDTGQTQCYENSDVFPISNTVFQINPNGCLFASAGFIMPPDQDGAHTGARSVVGPTAHATFTSDHTTTVQGVHVWKTCPEGLSGPTCATGARTMLTWVEAGLSCTNLNEANAGAGYAGRKDWRLPTIEELMIRYNYGADPSDGGKFPGTDGENWSATPNEMGGGTTFAKATSFRGGVQVTQRISAAAFNLGARCVAGTLPSRQGFVDNGDGTVTDNNTGLLWMKCLQSRSGANCEIGPTINGVPVAAGYGYWGAHDECTNLNFAGKTNWRLPNVNELRSIMDYTRIQPSIASVFPGNAAMLTIEDATWSSTTQTTIALPLYRNAWAPSYAIGRTLNDPKINGVNHVRCVANP
jgi:Protein of unknown function (DUF1566)